MTASHVFFLAATSSALLFGATSAFVPPNILNRATLYTPATLTKFTVLAAGSDDNPFKNPSLLEEGDVDPATLLGTRLEGTNLYFVGMMGSGKSAVGKTITARIGSYKFLDTDDVIEEQAGMSIPKIFETEGEPSFRDRETKALDSICNEKNCVISTGGGLVCREENWSRLEKGIVVYLNVDPEVIIKRIAGTDRPLLQTPDPLATLKELISDRQKFYDKCTIGVEVTAEMDLQATADAVCEAIHGYIDDHPPTLIEE